jgi:hypothetical protein
VETLDARLPLYFKATTAMRTAGKGPALVKTLLLEALKRLNEKLVQYKASSKLWMIGGGCMMLHFDARESSGDLDVIPRKGDFPALLQLAEQVAAEMTKEGKALPIDWLNGDFAPQLKTLNVGAQDFVSDPKYHWSNLEIQFARPELMLALKCFSFRSTGFDKSDLRFLFNAVPVRDLDHLYDILEHYGDIDMLQDGDDAEIEAMFKEVRGQRGVK